MGTQKGIYKYDKDLYDKEKEEALFGIEEGVEEQVDVEDLDQFDKDEEDPNEGEGYYEMEDSGEDDFFENEDDHDND